MKKPEIKIIALNRGKGKTTELIKLAAEQNAYIVCHSPDSVQYVAEDAKDMGLSIPFPVTYDEFLRHKGGTYSLFMIDDLDMFLRHIIDRAIGSNTLTVAAITVSPDETIRLFDCDFQYVKEVKTDG